jgi:hypothetical protein
MLRRAALVRTDVSEEPSASFIRVTRIGEVGTTLAATSNLLQEPHGITSQKTPFFNILMVLHSPIIYKNVIFGMLSAFVEQALLIFCR